MAIFKKEIGDLKWRFIVMLIIMTFLLLFTLALKDIMFTTMPGDLNLQIKNNKLISKLIDPNALKEQLNRMKKDYNYYVWSQWYAKNFFQFLLVAIILYGFSPFAREVEKGTMYFVLSKRVRKEVYLAKMLAGLTTVTVTVLIEGLLPVIVAPLFGNGFKPIPGIEITAQALAISAFLYTIVSIFSILMNDQIKPILISIGVFVGLGIFGWFKGTRYLCIYRYMMGTDIYLDHGFQWLATLLILATTGSLFYFGWKLFENKEF